MYFNVKTPLKIAGKQFKPCISYPISDGLLSTVRRLNTEGKAEISKDPVFFQNGAKMGKVKEVTSTKAEKTPKKSKKKVQNVTDDTADENEGF